MSASPDDILQRILSQGDPNAPGLLGMVNKATAQYGGAGNLGLQLLANSGYSSTPRSTGQVFAQSALNAQQFAAGAQEQQLKQQLIAAQLKALQAKPAVPTPQAIQEYEYAKQQGYAGTFADWQIQQKTSQQTPSGIQEYEYAVKQGFKGDLGSWQKLKEKTPEPTADIQGYNLATSQGFKGTYLDYLKSKTAQTSRGGGFTPEAGELLASMAAKGVALPAGMRSKEQQIATVNALLTKFPDKSADEIAEQIASGQIDFGAIRKETQTAAAQAGRVAIATNELKTFAPLVLEASGKVPRSQFIPINKLLQMGEESISDPNLLQLKIGINSMLNAYDQLAARGGTDMNKRAEAHSLLNKAQSPEALAAAIAMFQKEADAAGKAATEAERYHKPGETSSPKATPNVNARGWVLHTDKNGNKAYVSPDGKSYEEVK